MCYNGQLNGIRRNGLEGSNIGTYINVNLLLLGYGSDSTLCDVVREVVWLRRC